MEAAQILRALNPTDWLIGHSAAVADIAAFLADAIDGQGHAIHVPLAEAAALLHDIDKSFPADHELKPLPHGEGGAAWLRANGYDELAGSVANHPVTRLADDEHYFIWMADATVEERVVAYADKRATQDLVSLDARFDRWVKRHGDTDAMRVARERAKQLEQDICAAAGIDPSEVERLRWAATELRIQA
jgi:putative nucleotidyltransferase with HDIG domain